MVAVLTPLAPSAHAPLSPSSAARWCGCPGSYWAEQAAPPASPSLAADRGTLAHSIAARCLLSGAPPERFTDDVGLLPALQFALQFARQIIAGRPVLLECQLAPLPGLSQVWGTADLLPFDPCAGGVAAVLDFKFGSYAVEANSLQLGLYALLAARQFGSSPDGIDAWIIQPNCQHMAGPGRGVHYRAEDLLALEAYIRAAVARTALQDAPRVAGEWCTFYRAALTCMKRQQAIALRPKSNFFRSAA